MSTRDDDETQQRGADGEGDFAEVMHRPAPRAAPDAAVPTPGPPDAPEQAAGDAPPAIEAAPAAAEPAAPPQEPPARRGLVAAIQRLVPIGSLAAGIFGALVMDRGPDTGVLVAWGTLAAWLALLGVQFFGRPLEGDTKPPWWRRALHFSAVMAAQSIVQLQLFFALPFFARAMTFDPGHLLFMSGLLGLCVVSLWDPWFEAAMASRWLSPLLPGAGTFVVLVAVLPGTGLSTTQSLWVAAFVAAAGGPVVLSAAVEPSRRRTVASLGVAIGALFGLLLYVGVARIVPAAPLRLARADLGTTVRDKWVADPQDEFATAPKQLVCATAIASPIGVHDRLFHRWTRNGEPLAMVELSIVGGRKQGYRTRSRIRHFGREPVGTYTCRVETSAGQVLGSLSATIGD